MLFCFKCKKCNKKKEEKQTVAPLCTGSGTVMHNPTFMNRDWQSEAANFTVK